MERRDTKRIIIGFHVEIIYEGKSYRGEIDNLSETGVSVITSPTTTDQDFQQGATVELKFQPHPGETIVLNCRIKWSRKIPPRGLRNKIGLEIINPPWDTCGYFL
jgi:hypothetical protein